MTCGQILRRRQRIYEINFSFNSVQIYHKCQLITGMEYSGVQFCFRIYREFHSYFHQDVCILDFLCRFLSLDYTQCKNHHRITIYILIRYLMVFTLCFEYKFYNNISVTKIPAFIIW